MYSLSQIRKGLTSPQTLIMELNALYHRGVSAEYNRDGVDVFSEDWDSLVILDSCRYDTFADHCPFDGRLERRTSRGSGTYEFIKGNLKGRRLHDTVYITANPQFDYHREELDTEFHAVWNVWQDGWDEELRTVPPAVTTEAALEAFEQFPDKRLIVHYNQPHAPYIGPTGRSLDGFYGRMLKEDTSQTKRFPFGLIEGVRKSVDPSEHEQAFRENLELAFPHVESLLEQLDGRTVLTADHGQMLGERASPIPLRYHGHRHGVYVDELVTVPWFVHESGERREITTERGRGDDETVDDNVVVDRLHDLGYIGY